MHFHRQFLAASVCVLGGIERGIMLSPAVALEVCWVIVRAGSSRCAAPSSSISHQLVFLSVFSRSLSICFLPFFLTFFLTF